MSTFFIFMALIVGAIAFFHYTQGFFSATISAILAIFSAVLALSYHETIVESFLGGSMADSAHAMILMVLFAAIYTALRTAFDQLIKGGLAMPAVANKAGGAVMGAIAGVFVAGICAFAAQSMSFGPSIMGYSRIATDDGSASIMEGESKMKHITHPLYDVIQPSEPLNQIDERSKMLLPFDDILVDTTKMLSDNGSLSTSKPLASVHPDWLIELFGQRQGIEPGAKRVGMNLSGGKQTDVIAATGKDPAHPDAGAYLIVTPFPQKLGEQPEVSHIAIKEGDPFPQPLPGKIGIIVRCYFGSKAMDPKNNLVEVSCGSVRLVAQHINDAGDMEWTDYFPLGTYESGIVYRQRSDDYLFIDAENACADFVFLVDAKGFFQDSQQLPDFKTAATGDAKAIAAVKTWQPTAKLAEGTFIEVKRLAREDLSGQPIQDVAGLSRGKATFVRKELVRKPAPKPGENTVQVDPEALPTMTKKIVGTWEGMGQINGNDTTLNMIFQQNGKISGTSLSTAGVVKKTRTLDGTWKALEAIDNSTIRLSASFGELPEHPATAPEKVVVHFDNDDQITYTDKDGTGQRISFQRRSPSPNTGTGTTPGTTAQNPPNPTPPIAVPPDPSLQLLALPEESPKFFQAITVPAASGDATVAGGKVTSLDGKIAVLSLNDADQAALKGAGTQISSFMKPDGMTLYQAEAVPGAGNWGWKDRLDQIKGYDAAGNAYPLVGYWALVNDKLVARVNINEGGLSLQDYKATAQPTRMWLMFKGPENAAITKVMIGQAPVIVKQ